MIFANNLAQRVIFSIKITGSFTRDTILPVETLFNHVRHRRIGPPRLSRNFYVVADNSKDPCEIVERNKCVSTRLNNMLSYVHNY